MGYTNQSIIGTQNVNGVNKYYNASKRFSSVIAGINIPIFTGYLKASGECNANKICGFAGRICRYACPSEICWCSNMILRYQKNIRNLDITTKLRL
ncbi:MAG: hypothetical protein WKG06_37580 [Segetibacter sp.]